MKKTLTALSLVALLPAGAALASDDCSVPRSQWQSHEAALQVAQDNGWTVRDFEIDDGCFEIEGRDSDGRKIEVKLDPATLMIVELDYDDDDYRSFGRRDATSAGTGAVPRNGLIGNGTPPQVQAD